MKTLKQLQEALIAAEESLKALEKEREGIVLPYNIDVLHKCDDKINFFKGFIAGTRDAINEKE